MQKQRVKTSMSVPEMGKMLGLGKVESYWLVKKNYFKTIQVAGRMRVMLDSFEDWYCFMPDCAPGGIGCPHWHFRGKSLAVSDHFSEIPAESPRCRR